MNEKETCIKIQKLGLCGNTCPIFKANKCYTPLNKFMDKINPEAESFKDIFGGFFNNNRD